MSLSNPRTNTSPVQRFFELKLSTGAVTWYDKDAKKNVELDVPFKFVVLDTLSFVGGFNEPAKSGIWSNEVRSVRDEVLTVRTRKGVLAEGVYSDIKDTIKAEGGKFGNSVYIAFQEDGEWKLGNLKLIGAGVSAWFDFTDGKHLDRDPGAAVTGWIEKKKGRNEYFEPVIESWTVDGADLSAASALDEALQDYLKSSQTRKDPTPEPVTYTAPPQQASFTGDMEPPF
ncbi:hypothetical protein FHT44_004967 [Mycolicibacterium sp. BK634]|uniref:hypothetical protein n=1 Tax=Mycolicibacterium sp. BK634 TaxID=2587099 RepID=UPI00161813FD|nr:hypothetical protein [Mycolicibacterium sp. BK634]MBB3752455.1 hypothetical protein [Mycolicibacterium sp. BK634]